jgi:hypothetical protein
MLPLLFLIQAATEDAPPPPPPKPTEALRQIVVDAIRNCGKSSDGEVVVCARDRGIAEGYRIPKMDDRFARNLRPSGRGELTAAAEGAIGPGTCTKVGQGGAIGCTKEQIQIWAAERKRGIDRPE